MRRNQTLSSLAISQPAATFKYAEFGNRGNLGPTPTDKKCIEILAVTPKELSTKRGEAKSLAERAIPLKRPPSPRRNPPEREIAGRTKVFTEAYAAQGVNVWWNVWLGTGGPMTR